MPPITIGTASQSLAITALDATDAYVWGYQAHPSLRVRALDRATLGGEFRVDNADGSAVVFRLVGTPVGLTATVAGAAITIGAVSITIQEVNGVLRAKYSQTVATKPASNTVQWTVTLIGGATFTLNADKTASIKDASGVTTYTQPAPTAKDNANAAVTVTPTFSAGTLTYTLANIATGRYPLTVDPTTISTSTVATATEFSSDVGKMLYCPSDGMAVGLYWNGTTLGYQTSKTPTSSWNTFVALPGTPQLGGFSAYIESDDSISVLYLNKPSVTVQLHYVKLTRGASLATTYTAGTQVALASTAAFASGPHILRKDAQGTPAYWALGTGSVGTITGYVSTTPATATWTVAGSTTTNTSGGANYGLAVTSTYVVQFGAVTTVLTPKVKILSSANSGVFHTGATLTIPTTNSSDNIVTAVDGSGRIIMAIRQATPSVAVRTANFTPSGATGAETGTWSATTDIGESTTLDAYVTLVAVGSDVYCIWVNTTTKDIHYKIWSNAGSAWGSDNVLATATNAVTWLTAGASSSKVGVIWTEGAGSPFNIQYAEIALNIAYTRSASSSVAPVSTATRLYASLRSGPMTLTPVTMGSRLEAEFRSGGATTAPVSTAAGIRGVPRSGASSVSPLSTATPLVSALRTGTSTVAPVSLAARLIAAMRAGSGTTAPSSLASRLIAALRSGSSAVPPASTATRSVSGGSAAYSRSAASATAIAATASRLIAAVRSASAASAAVTTASSRLAAQRSGLTAASGAAVASRVMSLSRFGTSTVAGQAASVRALAALRSGPAAGSTLASASRALGAARSALSAMLGLSNRADRTIIPQSIPGSCTLLESLPYTVALTESLPATCTITESVPHSVKLVESLPEETMLSVSLPFTAELVELLV